MKHQVLLIEKKKYVLLLNEEYLSLKQDIQDLKKVLDRRGESSKEAKEFFIALKKKKPASKTKSTL